MNYVVVLLVTLFSSSTVKGQCPFSVTNSTVTTCDGSSKAGSEVNIDFHKINSPCTCTVIPAISGSLYIRAEEVPIEICKTVIKIVGGTRYVCPTPKGLSSLNVITNQPITVTAIYQPNYNSGAFYHCLGFYQTSDDIQVTCGSGSTTQTTTTEKTTTTSEETTTPEETTVYNTSTPMSSTETNPTTVSDTLPMKSTEPSGDELTNIIAGAGGGFVVIVIILIIVICVSMRKKTPGTKSAKGKLDTEHKNDAYDREADLPYNPLYHSNQPEDDVGYSTVEEEHHKALPPLQTNNDHSHNTKSPETNKQNKDHTPDLPVYAIPNKPKNTPTETTGGAVYAVPNKPKNTPTETTGGAVYAQINKPKKNTAQAPVRTQNQEGLVYMEVEHSDVPITQNAPHLNMSTAESVAYAEIQK